MLTRSYRLTKREDFQTIFKGGKNFFGSFFSIRYLPNNLDNSRFAVVVPNKVSKKAAVRNKLKRQIREIIKLRQDSLDKNYDVIVSALTTCLKKDFDFLSEKLTEAILNIK